MGIELKGETRIDWARPKGTPTGFETVHVYSGKQGQLVSAPIELATAKWTKPGEPTREVLGRLQSLRVNQRVTPVVLVVEVESGAVVLFGPNVDAAQTKPIAVDQAERILQAVLDEPNPVAARTRLSSLLQSLESTSIAGVKNSGLFANHELKEGVRKRADWARACTAALPLLSQRDHELIEQLGYRTTPAGAHALVLSGSGLRPEAIAVMLEEGETFEADSQRFSISPVAYGLKMAEQTGVPWLILARGSQLRLYPARVDLGVGRKGLAETFLEVDLPQLTQETAGYLTLVFSASALAEGGSAFEIMRASAIYAVALGERLRDKVYEDIVPKLSVAVAKQLLVLNFEMDAEGLDLAYQLTLRIFFRMLFQTYAEDRKLLPFGENEKYDRHALKTIALDLVETPDQPFDSESKSLWDDLAQVWRVIDRGDKAWGVPAYDGGLFGSDPELNEHGAIIETIAISNDVIGPCLKALLLDESDDGEFGPIDFRSLSVREFGTIYEGLLESSLGLAEVDLTLDREGTWLPAKAGDTVQARAGDVYFHNTSGQRKGTGSFYTPTFVVEHILERALDPAISNHLDNIAILIESGDQAGAAEAFFDFRVADLAMGSGHFLTAAIDHIEQKMAAFLEEEGHQIPGVAKEVILLGNAAKEAIGDPDGPAPEGSSLLRRQIARRCIYGLDINPISVELARVAIWIHTFVRGLPMSSLDHNLVCANSLTGIGSVDEALDVLVPNRNGAATFFDAPIEDALRSAQSVLADVALLSEIDRKETQAATRAMKRARKEAEEAKLLFDGAVLTRIHRTDLIDGMDPKTITAQAAEFGAQEAIAPLSPGHMPVLFPEVFLRDNGGFDVLIGNPPWEELMLDEVKFWLRIQPGLLGLPMKERKAAIESLRSTRSDLIPLLEQERFQVDTIRTVLLAGPYPGLGTGDVDLYQVFAWRNWQLLRENGRSGMVFPRTLLNAAGGAEWRSQVLDRGDISVVTLTNSAEWIFPGVDGRYSIALVDICKNPDPSGFVKLCGPFYGLPAFSTGRESSGKIPVALIRAASTGAAFPQLPDAKGAEVFAQLRMAPRLDEASDGWEFQPVAEFHATNDRPIFDSGEKSSSKWMVYGGSSFNIWHPETGEVFAWAEPQVVSDSLQRKRLRQINLRSSAFYGMKVSWASDPLKLPCTAPRLAYRQITRSTDTRTVIAALVPGHVVLTNSAPYFLRRKGTLADEAYLLGVMCSIPFDWYARRYVELNLNFHIVNGMPVPRPVASDPRRLRIIELAGRLAACDNRFAGWAEEVGVPVGSVASAGQQDEMVAELDALVASLYGLSRSQIEHIFSTFHRGWVYQPRLVKVLEYFDKIEATT